MSTEQQDQDWNAGATEIQQLNTGGCAQRQSIKHQPTYLNVLGRSLHWVRGPTRRRAVKEDSKVLTMTGLTAKHAVCRITFMLYPVLL